MSHTRVLILCNTYSAVQSTPGLFKGNMISATKEDQYFRLFNVSNSQILLQINLTLSVAVQQSTFNL